MGLDIASITIMDGLVTLTGLYGHARDIKITKEGSEYKIECFFHIYKDVDGHNRQIETMFIGKVYSEDFLTKTWNDVYTLIKAHLDSRGIQYTDSI